MVGHGRPREGPRAFAGHRERQRNGRPRYSRVVACRCALIVFTTGLLTGSLLGDELNLRLRITWGGGERRPWRGTVVAREGQLLAPKCLGIEADVPDDLVLERDTVRITQPIPTAFDGLDVQVIGTDETTLVLEFAPADKPEAVKKVEILLTDFVPAAKVVYNEALDDQGNFLQVQRAPGDRLRVEFERASLVFAPGEEFQFTVQPHELGLPNTTTLRCMLQLQPVDSEEVLWRVQHDLRVDASGGTSPIGPVKLPLPEAEGVYDIVVSLTRRRFTDNLVPGTLGNLVSSKPLMQRKVQVIVLEDQPQPVGPAEWQLVEEIDMANPKWSEKLNWLPQWKVLPGMSSRGPLGDRPLLSRDFLGQTVHELGSSGWHAAPIPIQEIGQPHILEIEYPTDQRQTLGISVVEPNAAGEVRTLGIDSGVDISGHPKPATPKLGKHRLIFWPHTETPVLLLTNRRNDSPAVFGKIRVFAGPAHLPPMELTTVDGERLFAAHYDKPLFTENFGAAESIDAVTGRSHKDWQTFYLGALRLVEYLKHAGFNAAVVSVACDGGTLYPSNLLDTTPKFDNGVLFQSGQDPLQKDALEMLLRIFDREGLKLIPAIQYSSPLPTLEADLRAGQSNLGGIAMVGFFPGDDKPKLGRADSRQGAAPFYNPLDPRVQNAMRQVAAEVLDRCSKHKSFAGLAVQLSPYGYAVLPDDACCLDDATFARFAQAAQQPNPLGQDSLNQRLQLVRGPAREQWLHWRAAELTKFYRDLSIDVRQSKNDAKLLLTTTDLASGRVLQNSLRPRLPARANFAEAMLRHGIDAAGLSQIGQTLLLRPHRTSVSAKLAAHAAQLELAQSEIVDDYFRLSGQTSTIGLNEPLTLRLPGFDLVSPFGAENTSTNFASHILPAGENSRARLVHDLANLDSPLISDGGWMLPLGQEESQSRFVRVFRELPVGPFTTIKPSAATGSSQLAVRSLHQPGRTYLYVANPTRLAATVQVDLAIPTPCEVYSLDGRPPPILPAGGGPTTWTISLEPYDVGAVFSPNDIQVTDWNVQFDRESVAELGGMVQELRVRVDQLSRFQPKQVISNPDFEQPSQPGQIPGWTFARNPGVTVELDANHPYQGGQSLHLRVEGRKSGWVRSQWFPMPRTGRLSVQAWIRTRDATQQPPLRMSVDGKLASGQPYYKWWPLGVDVDGRSFQPTNRPVLAVPAEWTTSPILIHLIDLPVSGAGEVCVGFDMQGSGEVWIDNIQISDVFFEPTELNELRKNVFNAHYQLQHGEQLAECQRFLQGYWPRFVLEFVPPPRLSQVPSASSRLTPAKVNPPPPQPAEKTSKWKQLLPANPLMRQFNKADNRK